MSADTLLVLAIAGLVAVGCDSGGGAAWADAELSSQSAALRGHTLSRTGYGPDAWSRGRIESLGVGAYIEEQLEPTSIPEDRFEEALLVAFPSLGLDFDEIKERYATLRFIPLLELTDAKLVRSIVSARQLEQVLTDFWFDHFNVFGPQLITRYALVPYERDAIRPNVLGRFEDLLIAVARHPAMLSYLDNYLSTREGFDDDGVIRGLNENYARELLELHTLGVAGGYDQQDVIEVARAFTGWTIGPPELSTSDGFFFRAAAHDDGPKQLMGELILPAGGGLQDGIQVAQFLARHPKTAARVCRKLVERFVNENAPAGLVDDCKATYLATRGDLREVTGNVLLSPEFRNPANFGTKVKRPLVLVASFARASGARLTMSFLNNLEASLKQLGESPYSARHPIGYPDRSSHWAGGSALFERMGMISRWVGREVARGNRWGALEASSEEIVSGLAARLLAAAPDDQTRDEALALIDAVAQERADRRVREGATMLLLSPNFMRH